MISTDHVATALQRFVDDGSLAGLAARIWRNGEEPQTTCVGWRDMEAALPVEHDTLFRIASLSKPITSAAALLQWEEGKFALTDPISR